jgi:hypothetical protein
MKLARGSGGVENKASGDTPYVASLVNGRLNLIFFLTWMPSQHIELHLILI